MPRASTGLIQRGGRPRIFDVLYQKPKSIVRRKDILEVGERMAADGSVVAPLEEGAAAKVDAFVAAGGYKAVAICLLNSYANPAHEQALAKMIAVRTVVAITNPAPMNTSGRMKSR